MPLSALVYFYRRRLRTHPVQEALAAVGVAIGVALVFAVLVANDSITSGSSQVVRSIVGAADLQLRSRSPSGVDQRLLDRVRALTGVRLAVPALELAATARGPTGHELIVHVVSADVSFAGLGATHNDRLQPRGPEVVALPGATARALGVSVAPDAGLPRSLPEISLSLRGRAEKVRVGAVLGPEAVGPLSNATAVVAPLPAAQRIAALPGRITGVLVASAPGFHAAVQRELARLAGGRLTLARADEDVRLLREATRPNGKATGFFAFVSALVGLLLAFNAMLLSAPERRRMIADLRIQGTRPGDLVRLLLFQALCLGVVASAIGVLLGALLSRSIFHQTPGYLAAAFPLGTQTVIGWRPLALAMVGGVIATCLAAAPPLLDLRRSRAVDAVYFERGEPGQGIGRRARWWLFGGSIALVSLSSCVVLALGPATTVLAVIGLALASVLAIPISFTAVVWLAQLVAARARSLNMLLMATRALRATTARSLALAATGAVAVFGSISAEGAHRDLLNGLYRDYSEYVSTASLWITGPRDYLATNAFPSSGLAARLARLPGVADVRSYRGGFFDLAGRRVWLVARSRAARAMVPPGQVLAGDVTRAQERIRRGGWVTVSEQLARASHVKLGGKLSLPTPTGTVSYRVAATTTNLGWTGGAIVLNEDDYARAWGSSDLSALEVDLSPGASPPVVKRAAQSLIGQSGGLVVQTAAGRAARADALAREGLSRLSQIALLLMIAAALAMAAAMGASIWQRRPSLASLRIQSFRPSQLRAILLCESTLVLATGSLTGAATGVYGHALIDRYLRAVTGFPAPFSVTLAQVLLTIGAVMGAALAVLAVPGVIASRAPARLALQE